METITTTKKEEKIIANLLKDSDFKKGIKRMSHYDELQFIKDAKVYIKAIKERRMINSIGSVSSSGMSRTIKFLSCEKSKHQPNDFYYRNYHALFLCLGYSEARGDRDYFSISGGGMDMIFHSNYSNIHQFARLGLITKTECKKLCQMTPTTI